MNAIGRSVLAALVGVLALAIGAGSAVAGVANGGLSNAPNPLAGIAWGNYSGPDDEVFPAYDSATGTDRQLLARIALAPRMRWYGPWYPDAEQAARDYLDNVTGGDPRVMAQIAVFRLVPWEGDACRRLPSASEQASYRRWIDAFARGIGDRRVALVLQPDLPFELCVPHRSQVPLGLVAYAAQVFSALPHTTVYIDAGASDWASVGSAVWILRHAGVSSARGFALGATHYSSTADEIRYGARVAAALARARIGGVHFVINTAQNGRGFTYQQYHGSNYDNAAVCRSRTQSRCVTLGIPPTTNVTDRRLGLAAGVRHLARRYVDAYLWIGRPWLDNQNDPFDLGRALALARTSPF